MKRLRIDLEAAGRPWMVVGGLTLLGALLRLHNLGYKSLWYDEAVLYWISRGSVHQVIAQNAAGNSAPPTYALLISLISRLGDSEAVLRSGSCLAGIAAIPAIYFLARGFTSRGVTYLCAAVVTIAPSQIKYSQQLREYSLAFLLATLMLALFHRYVSSPTFRNVVLFTAVAAAGIFVQYGLALLLLALNLAFLLRVRPGTGQRQVWFGWCASQLAALCSVIAVYLLSLKQQMAPGGFGAAVHLGGAYWDRTFGSLVKLAVDGTYGILYFSYPAESLALLLCCLGLLAAFQTREGRLAAMLLVLPFLCTFGAALLRLYPYYGSRQSMFLVPMVYVTFGIACDGVASVGRRHVFALAVATVLALVGLRSTVAYLSSSGDENMRPVAAVLAKEARPEDAIYVYHGAVPSFAYYSRNREASWVPGKSPSGDPEAFSRQLDGLLAGKERLWLVLSRCDLPWLPSDECSLITDWVSRVRPLELAASDKGVWLYRTIR